VGKALVAATKDGTAPEEAMKEMHIGEEEAAILLGSMGKSQGGKIVSTLQNEEAKMVRQVEKGKEKIEAAAAGDNHTYYEEIDEEDEEGRRILRYIPHPNSRSIVDDINDIEASMRHKHRRRLEEIALPKDTSDFEHLLSDHMDELHGHIRELKMACNGRSSGARCVADNLDDYTEKLLRIQQQTQGKLMPVNDVLTKMSNGQKVIANAETTVRTVHKALDTARKYIRFMVSSFV